VIYQIKE